MRLLSILLLSFYCLLSNNALAQIPPESSTVRIVDTIIRTIIPQAPNRIITYMEIELIAGRNSGYFMRRMQSIDKLNTNQITELPARSLPEALTFVGGVDVRQRGISGTQADIGIRGGNFEQSLIVVNGFKMTDPQTGHHAANLPIPLLAVSEIQVFKSPTVLQFGQSALTGAVHISTQLNLPQELKVSTYGGSFNSLGAQALLRTKIKKYQQLLAVSSDQSNGHWYNSDFKNHQLFYTASHPIGINEKQQLSYLVAFTDRNFGANGFYSNKYPDQWEHTSMAMAGIKHQVQLADSRLILRQQLLLRRHSDEFRLKRFDPTFYTNSHVSNVLGYELHGTYYMGRQRLDFGIEERFEQLQSSNLGLRERQYQSTFFQGSGFLGEYSYAAGLLVFAYDWQNPQLMPSIQLGRSFKAGQYLFANYSKGNRVPSWTEMYYSDPSNIGNPNLQPEYSHATEIGWRKVSAYRGEYRDNKRLRIQAGAALFYRQHTNMIDWVRDASEFTPNPNPWKPVNIASVAFRGLETNLQFTLRSKNTWAPSKLNFNYTYISAQHDFSSEQESRYAITSMRHQLNSLLFLDLSKHFKLSLTSRFIQRIDESLFQVIDAKIQVPLNNDWVVFAEANNLTDTQYVEAGFVQMPGRWFKLGLTYSRKAKERVGQY